MNKDFGGFNKGFDPKALIPGVIIVVLIIVISIACGGGPKFDEKGDGLNWSISKSPITGNCYEIATRYSGNQGYMGMSKVSCEYLGK